MTLSKLILNYKTVATSTLAIYRERGETETETETDRQTETERDRDKERETERDTERDRKRETETERKRGILECTQKVLHLTTCASEYELSTVGAPAE